MDSKNSEKDMKENDILLEENDLRQEEKITEEQAVEKTEEMTEIEILNKRIQEFEEQSKLYNEQLLRKAAEFENYKRRTENENSNLIKFANEYLISDLLPVLDDFERSLNSSRDKPDFEAFYKGVELIYSKFFKILEQRGLKQIDSLNKPFDVNFHEAVLIMAKEEVPPSTVIQEIAKGYLLHDKVIRHTQVIVSGELQKTEEENTDKKD